MSPPLSISFYLYPLITPHTLPQPSFSLLRTPYSFHRISYFPTFPIPTYSSTTTSLLFSLITTPFSAHSRLTAHYSLFPTIYFPLPTPHSLPSPYSLFFLIRILHSSLLPSSLLPNPHILHTPNSLLPTRSFLLPTSHCHHSLVPSPTTPSLLPPHSPLHSFLTPHSTPSSLPVPHSPLPTP